MRIPRIAPRISDSAESSRTADPIPPLTPDAGIEQAWAQRRRPVGGVDFVARTPLAAAADVVEAASNSAVGRHLHLANAYSIGLARTDAAMMTTLRSPSAWNLPDGKPVVWTSALRRDAERLHQVRGPQFLLDVADLGREQGLTHYLLGGAPEVLERLTANLETRFPGIRIVGADSPPFRVATAAELDERDDRIRASGAQIVWVGLGTPKQDFEAHRLAERLPVTAVAVGAAFDYAAGTLRPAPHWVSAIGMEWLWRLIAEPRRLWRRYTVGSASFLAAVVSDELGRRRARRMQRSPGSSIPATLQQDARSPMAVELTISRDRGRRGMEEQRASDLEPGRVSAHSIDAAIW